MFKRSTSRHFCATTFHSLYQDREFLWNISNPYLIDALEQEFAFNGDNTAQEVEDDWTKLILKGVKNNDY